MPNLYRNESADPPIAQYRSSEQLKAEEAAYRKMRVRVIDTCQEYKKKIDELIAERDRIIAAHRAEYDAAVEEYVK